MLVGDRSRLRARARPVPLLLVVALAQPVARPLTLDDLPPAIRQQVGDIAASDAAFSAYLAAARTRDRARMREGDLDHLVHFALQSTTFTTLPPIEPALSAKAFVESGSVPASARARLDALASAAARKTRDARLAYFRDVLDREWLARPEWPRFLAEEYGRAMRVLYRKEFEDARSYEDRGLSTDTAVEAGYAVQVGLASLRQLEPNRRIRTVLIVGPGLDLAPRTGLIETAAPQSYQPFAVIDALFALGLASRQDLQVVCGDINPRVVDWIRRARGTRLELTLVTAVAETDRVRFTVDYRAYFASLGGAIGRREPARVPAGHLGSRVRVDTAVSGILDGTEIDVVTDRLDRRFDLVVVTNVFPYLADRDLLLAFTNIVSVMAPGGVLLHNEPRPILGEAAAALGLRLLHSRSVVIANVAGGRSPLYDTVFVHGR
jgi:hypothetical protein